MWRSRELPEQTETELGYCRKCKEFGTLVKIHDVEAWPPGMDHTRVPGLFSEDEVKFRKEDHGFIGIDLSKEAFEGCKFRYVDEEETVQLCEARGLDMCPFHVYGFIWGSETYYLIDCDCLHDAFNNYAELKKHWREDPPCIRDEEFDDFSKIEYNSVVPIVVEDAPQKAVMQKKLPGESVIPLILKASTFVHVLTHNVDNYFLGILQTLAVKGVNVTIALNPSALGKGRLRVILNVASYSRRNLRITVNNKVHAKRIFIDGTYDLDLSSVNLSYKGLYDNIENIPEFSFSMPSLNKKVWGIIKDVHDQKFIPAFREGKDIFEWCAAKKPDIYKECSKAFQRRKKEMELIEKMAERPNKKK